MEIVVKSQVTLENRGNWCDPFGNNQDILGQRRLFLT